MGILRQRPTVFFSWPSIFPRKLQQTEGKLASPAMPTVFSSPALRLNPLKSLGPLRRKFAPRNYRVEPWQHRSMRHIRRGAWAQMVLQRQWQGFFFFLREATLVHGVVLLFVPIQVERCGRFSCDFVCQYSLNDRQMWQLLLVFKHSSI